MLNTLLELSENIDFIPESRKTTKFWELEQQQNIFDVTTIIELHEKTRNLPSEVQDNLFFKWFNYVTNSFDRKCFINSGIATENPNIYDKSYHFKIGRVPFLLNYITLSEDMLNNFELILRKPMNLVNTYLTDMVKDVKEREYNRIFIVYGSRKTPNNINHLRVNAYMKMEIITKYLLNYDKDSFLVKNHVGYDLIFITEDVDGKIHISTASKTLFIDYGENT